MWTILIVEDNEAIQLMTAKLLARRGWQIMQARNGREAVDYAASQAFDAILMDVQMPEMNGLDAIAAIRRQEAGSGRRIPIIVITAYTTPYDQSCCLAAGADEYLPKPVPPPVLYAAIERLCQPAT